MEIKRSGSQPSSKGQAEHFTGSVRVDPLFDAPAPARVMGANVTFEPGARTAWHSHPLGQTLIVTAGCGRAQRWGGPIEAMSCRGHDPSTRNDTETMAPGSTVSRTRTPRSRRRAELPSARTACGGWPSGREAGTELT